MRRGKKYKFINIYLPFLFLGIIFAFVLNGILSTEYIDDTEKFTNKYEEINKIPNTEKDIDNFKYNIYIVTEPVSINALAEKLQTDPNIILYNNPYIIGKDMLQEGDRIILYDDPIVFYRINENDTIEKISEKFGISKEEIFKENPELADLDIQYKRYLIVKNPLITENTLKDLKAETIYENTAYNLNSQHELINEEKAILQSQKEKNTGIQYTQNNVNSKGNFEEKSNFNGLEYKEKKPEEKAGSIPSKNSKEKNQKDIPERNPVNGDEISKYMLWPVSSTNITSGYGYRVHPILKTKKFHRGLDISSPKGTPLKASFTGIVTYASTKGGYGNLIEVERADGIRVRYAHLDKISVSEGDSVKEGQVIGATGSTGLSTGPHLHFEILVNGEPVDPKKWNYY